MKQLKSEPILVETQEDIEYLKKIYKREQHIKYICCNPNCKHPENIGTLRNAYLPRKCNSCISYEREHNLTDEQKAQRLKSIEDAYIRKYGSIENAKLEISNATKEAIRNKYGVDNSFQAEECKEKIRQTCMSRFGADNYMKTEQGKNRLSDILSNRPKDEIDKSNEKRRQTNLLRFGTDWALQNNDVKSKIKETNLRKYGVENVSQADCVKQKKLQKAREIYGVEHALQCKAIFNKVRSVYYYNNEVFDSSWELAFYIYNIDNNKDIIHEPCSFEYVFENKTHFYFPDFLIDGIYYEIKGDQFFDGDKMINPFDRTKDDFINAKYQCMLNNNVIVLREKDMANIINYINNKYGSKYLKSFKRQINENNL